MNLTHPKRPSGEFENVCDRLQQHPLTPTQTTPSRAVARLATHQLLTKHGQLRQPLLWTPGFKLAPFSSMQCCQKLNASLERCPRPG